jgi:cyclopropane fatty-acyl-phospholipid synthase-like methyltransferase
MPDVYAVITEVEPAVVDQVAEAMEVSAADPQQREMVAAYLTDLALADDARVLEIGCGTNAVSRTLAGWPGVGDVLGVDPSPILLGKARELSRRSTHGLRRRLRDHHAGHQRCRRRYRQPVVSGGRWAPPAPPEREL